MSGRYSSHRPDDAPIRTTCTNSPTFAVGLAIDGFTSFWSRGASLVMNHKKFLQPYRETARASVGVQSVPGVQFYCRSTKQRTKGFR